jgi:hypothetical protein
MAQSTTWRGGRARNRRRRGRAARARRILARALTGVRGTPWPIRVVIGLLLLIGIWAAANAVVQVVRKPSELFFPVSSSFAKSPAETWREYGALFTRHSTAVVTPELLASLAQVEASGNPLARTYWRWRFSLNPFNMYRPASSAVGLFQITDGTFAQAKRYCIHDHLVVEDGPWYDLKSCWFNALYTRVVPGHAIEMTAALLDRTVARTLAGRRFAKVSLRQRQDLAAVIHLCGSGAGRVFARSGFRFSRSQRCGDHDARRYLARVNAVKRQFTRLAAAD